MRLLYAQLQLAGLEHLQLRNVAETNKRLNRVVEEVVRARGEHLVLRVQVLEGFVKLV
jgi:hypothetical protein